jgi:hypothetical protein
VVARRDGQPIGFALARKSGRGSVIGPVVAPDESLAITLIAHHLINNSGGFVRVDIPTDAVQLANWLERAGLARVDRVTVMVRGEVPERSSPGRLFALVSQALN